MTTEKQEAPAGGGARSAITVGAGLAVLALSASAFLILSARAVGPEAFAGLAVLWTLVYTVGIGLFVPFEQEVAREVAVRETRGEGSRGVVVKASGAAAALFAAMLVVVALLSPWLVSDLLGGSGWHVVAFVAACGALGMQYIQRGVLAGTGGFGAYSAQLGAEGVLRLVASVALLLVGVSAPEPFAAVLALAPIASVLLVLPTFVRRGLRPGPRVSLSSLSANLGWLVGAALAAQGLANLATVAVKLLAEPDEAAQAGHFLAGFTVARIPLLMFAAIQAVLLPGLARLLAHGEHVTFRRQLRLVLLVTGALGLAGTVGAWLIGPEVLGLLFGDEFDIARRDLTLLSIGTSVYMLGLVLQPAVVALHQHRANAIAWVSGLAIFLLALLLPLSTFARVELALILGSAVVVVLLAWRVRRDLAALTGLEPDVDPALGRIGLE
jgi:O-antigen/teichoic acid export membrane protein